MVNALFTSKSGIAQMRAWRKALVSSGVIRRVFNAKPIWAQMKITDRCNLRCGYCTEFKDDGKHVDSATVSSWIHHCEKLGVKHVEFIGGEPLLHPDLPRFLSEARELKMNTGLTTNGFLLNELRAKELVSSGIRRLQISIDCIEPNSITKKAFSSLKKQLEICAKLELWFHVNSVLSSETLPEARKLAELLFENGIPVAFSPAHFCGSLIIGDEKIAMIDFFNWLIRQKAEGKPVNMPNFLIDYYKHIFMGEKVSWMCEGGCKAFYVNTDGQFCLCSHKQSSIKFFDVDQKVLRKNHTSPKGCEDQCGVSCMIVNSFPFNRLHDVVRSDIFCSHAGRS